MTVHWRAAVRFVGRLALAAACGALGVLAAAAPSDDSPSAQTADEGQWVRAAGDYGSTRYSALRQP